MKRYLYNFFGLILGLTALLALFVASCGAPSEKVMVAASKPQYQNKIGYSSANKGNHYVIFTVEITNSGSQAHHANPNNFTLVDDQDRTYSYDPATHDMTLQGKDLQAVDVQPGKKTSGVVVFQIPKEAKAKELIYKPMFGNEITIKVE